MFNFLVMMKEGETTALLSDGGYNVTFLSSERRTCIRSTVSVGDEHQRISVCRQVHNEKHVGAAASQFDGVAYIL